MPTELFPSPPTKGEQTRRKLLLAALMKFGEHGYENASVREIADEAGQNVAAIAYHFGNKEKLYVAVLSGIGDYIAGIHSALVREVASRQADGTLTAAAAREFLKGMMRNMLQEMASGELAKIRLVMMREQSSPSSNFDVLYLRTIEPLHRLLAVLVGTATGTDPEADATILRGHALFGQVICFQVARSTIQRRLGADPFSPAHLAEIETLIGQHIDLICTGLNPSHP